MFIVHAYLHRIITLLGQEWMALLTETRDAELLERKVILMQNCFKLGYVLKRRGLATIAVNKIRYSMQFLAGWKTYPAEVLAARKIILFLNES